MTRSIAPKFSALTFLAFAACTEIGADGVAADGINGVSMDKVPFVSGGGDWRGAKGEYEYVFTVQNINGKAGVCGILDDDTVGIATAMNKLLRNFQVLIDGQVIARGFNHFTRVEDSRARGLIGRCKAGNVDWSNDFTRFRDWEVKVIGGNSFSN